MSEKCPLHDHCFNKIETQLADLDAKMDQALLALADGSGVHKLLGHRLSLLEKIIFGLVALALTAIVTGMLALVIKGII